MTGGTFNGSTNTTNYSGSFSVTGGTYNSASTTVFQGTNSGTTIDVNVSQNFHNITFSSATYSRTITSSDTITALGDITFSAVVAGGTTEAYGDVTVSTTETTALVFRGSDTQTFNLTGATGSYNADITINKSGGEVQLASTLTMDAASQDLTIQEGTFNINGNTLTVNGSSGTFPVQDGGTFKFQGGETLTINSGYPTLTGSSTVEYTGSSSYTIKGYTYRNLYITGSGSFTATSGPLTIGGSFIQSDGTFTAAGATTTIAGNITRTAGTFTHNSGTVHLNGASQAVNDSTTFNNLYKVITSTDTLTFEAGATTTIAGTMTLRGASGNVLTLQSSTNGSPWYIDPQSTRSISYLDVNDSYNSNATVIEAAGTNSTDGGGNTNWRFETNAPTAGSVTITDTQLDALTVKISGASDDTALATLPYVFHNITTDVYFTATSSTYATSTGLSNGTSYTFEVGVYDVYGNSATTSSVSGSTLSPSSPSDSGGGNSGGGSSSGNGRGGISDLFSVLINNGEFYTNTKDVILNLKYPPQSNAVTFLVSNTSDFSSFVSIPITPIFDWVLCSLSSCPNGEYFVYVKYLDNKDKTLSKVSDSIILQTTTVKPPPIIPPSTNPGNSNPPTSPPGNGGGTIESLKITATVSSDGGDFLPISYGNTLTDFKLRINTETSIKSKIDYQIDWDSDGIFDDFLSSNVKTITTSVHNFTIPGEYVVFVRASSSDFIATSRARIIVENPQFESTIAGSLDRKNWTTNLYAPIDSTVSFRIESFGNVEGWYSYNISCDSSGIVDREYKKTTRTTYIARNTCLYTQSGIYTVTLIATNGSLVSTSQMFVVVGSDPAPPPPISTSTPPTTPPVATSTPPILSTTTPPISNNPPGGAQNGEGTIDRVIADVVIPFVDHTSYIASSIFADLSENKIFNVLTSLLPQIFSILRILLALLESLVGLIKSNPDMVAIISGAVAIPILTVLRNMLSPFAIRNFFDLYAGVLSVFNNFLTWSHLRTKRRYWGMVYDSENKQPIDPAIVTLINIHTDKIVETAVTDLYGRYGFMNYMGQFRIDAKKTHYLFPSNKILGDSDGLFNNVYHGEVINIEKVDDLITPNIPMDRMFYDWNQEFKTVHIHPRVDYILSYIFKVLSLSLTAVVLYLFIFNTSLITTISLALTIIMMFVSRAIPQGKLWGRVKDDKNRDISIVLYYEGLSNVVVSHAVISDNGRYFLKTLPGKYILSVRNSKSGLEIYKTHVKVGKIGVVNKEIDISEISVGEMGSGQ